jgi:fucose permease
MVGGALVPAVAGAAADAAGIAVIIPIAIGAIVVALFVYGFGITEPKTTV